MLCRRVACWQREGEQRGEAAVGTRRSVQPSWHRGAGAGTSGGRQLAARRGYRAAPAVGRSPASAGHLPGRFWRCAGIPGGEVSQPRVPPPRLHPRRASYPLAPPGTRGAFHLQMPPPESQVAGGAGGEEGKFGALTLSRPAACGRATGHPASRATAAPLPSCLHPRTAWHSPALSCRAGVRGTAAGNLAGKKGGGEGGSKEPPFFLREKPLFSCLCPPRRLPAADCRTLCMRGVKLGCAPEPSSWIL